MTPTFYVHGPTAHDGVWSFDSALEPSPEWLAQNLAERFAASFEQKLRTNAGELRTFELKPRLDPILDPSLSFVAIDFETANTGRESVCAVGIVAVDAKTRTMRKWSSLVRPPSREFSYHNQKVHGLSWRDVAGKPTFAELWPAISAHFEGAAFLVAHNAPFDRDVLEKTCAYYNIAPPPLPWECTVALAKTIWKGQGCKLNECAARIGFALDHHEAGSDSEACARIVIWARDRNAPNQEPVTEAAPIVAAPAPSDDRKRALASRVREFMAKGAK